MNIKKLFIVSSTIIFLAIAASALLLFNNKKSNNNDNAYYLFEIFRDNQKLKYWAVKEELTIEVNNYIQSVAPQSIVDGLYLINDCEKYQVDITFVLAQGTLESHFATKGIGGKINSIFNVCVYDSIKDGNNVNKNYKYPHPNKSIEPYLKLLTADYLINGKTEQDLLENYVNKNGKRYASYVNYEQDLSSIIDRIKSNTKIDSLYKELNNYNIY